MFRRRFRFELLIRLSKLKLSSISLCIHVDIYVYYYYIRAIRSRSLRDRNSLTKAASRPLFVRTRPLRGLACIMYYNTRRFAPRFLISYMYGIKLYSIGESVSFSHSNILNKCIVIDLHLLLFIVILKH